jgi:hypothetical protein
MLVGIGVLINVVSSVSAETLPEKINRMDQELQNLRKRIETLETLVHTPSSAQTTPPPPTKTSNITYIDGNINRIPPGGKTIIGVKIPSSSKISSVLSLIGIDESNLQEVKAVNIRGIYCRWVDDYYTVKSDNNTTSVYRMISNEPGSAASCYVKLSVAID